MKNFYLGERLVETRFMMHHNDKTWGGYTYEWNDEGTDATLLLGGKEKEIDGQMWVTQVRTNALSVILKRLVELYHLRLHR